MKEKFIEWFTAGNSGYAPAIDADGKFEKEKTQHMWEAYQAGLASAEAQVKQLAAENAALKSNLMFWDAEDPESPYDCPEDIANNFAMDFNTEFDVQVAAKMPNRTYRVSEVGEYDCKIELVSGGMPETPATDAILASLRAEGVEVLRQHPAIQLCSLTHVCDEVVAQLRSKSEVQS